VSFFYNLFGDKMKVYLDKIFFLNFCFDFILLLSVSIILRRNVSIKRILFGSLIGALSIFSLFIKISNLELFILKIFISFIMVIVSFEFKNIKYTIKNLEYLYMSSLVLAGFLYFINAQFSYKQEGLVFYHNGISINFILLIILSPIIIYIYIKQAINLKNNYSNYYKIDIYINDKIYKLNGFLDTGNKLKDPLTQKSVILIKEKIIKEKLNFRLIPFTTISEKGLIKCIKVDKVYIKGVGIKKNVLVCLMKNLNMEGIDCILNQSIIEE